MGEEEGGEEKKKKKKKKNGTYAKRGTADELVRENALKSCVVPNLRRCLTRSISLTVTSHQTVHWI